MSPMAVGVALSILVAPPSHAGCSVAGARAAVQAAALPASFKAIALQRNAGVDRVICHDLTGDGRVDMAATVFSGGTAGDIAWVLFRRTRSGWSLAFRRLEVYKVGLFLRGIDLVESQPIYRKDDPNCCPTGGFDHLRVRWNGARFVVSRRWHTNSFRP